MKGFTLWFTGLSGSGKTTLSRKAAKFLLEYTGQFIPKRQHLNIYANISPQDKAGSFQDVIDEFLIKLGASGYPVENLVKRYHELKTEGAF